MNPETEKMHTHLIDRERSRCGAVDGECRAIETTFSTRFSPLLSFVWVVSFILFFIWSQTFERDASAINKPFKYQYNTQIDVTTSVWVHLERDKIIFERIVDMHSFASIVDCYLYQRWSLGRNHVAVEKCTSKYQNKKLKSLWLLI